MYAHSLYSKHYRAIDFHKEPFSEIAKYITSYNIPLLELPVHTLCDSHNYSKIHYTDAPVTIIRDTTMLLVYVMPATLLRSWGHNTTKPETESTSITNPASEESIQYTDSRANFDEYTTKTSESGCRTPASASSDDFDSTSGAALHYNTPTTPTVGDTTSVSKLYQLDTTTFPFHAVHLMPSEPNGTWNTQVIYAVTNSSRSAPTLREVYQEQMPKLDVPTLVRKLTQIAENTKEDLEGWLNKTLANQDLGEIHNRLLHLVAGPSMPNIRQIDEVIDAVTETMQLLQKKSSDSELLEKFRDDKHLFAEVVSQGATRFD